MIINKNNFGIQTMSTHPNDNWMGDDWVLVPPGLEEAALRYSPYCRLEYDMGGALIDIIDNPEARPTVTHADQPRDPLAEIQETLDMILISILEGR